MDRRSFLAHSLQGVAVLFVAGCGGGGDASSPGAASGGAAPSVPSLLARVSPSVVFAFDAAGPLELEPHAWRITRRDVQGRPAWTAGGSPQDFNFPVAAEGAADGQTYVLSQGDSEVHVLNSAGFSQGRFGTFGFGDGNLAYPSDLTLDPSGTEIFVADTLNHRVQVFNLGGSPLRRFRLGGNEWFRSLPKSLAFDPRGHLHVADAGLNVVHVVDGNGAPIATYGGPADFVMPRAVAVDRSGVRYVADSVGRTICVFDPDGQPLSVLPCDRTPLHVAVGPDQRLYLHVA